MLTYEKQKDSDRCAIEKWASRGYLRIKTSLDHAQLLGHHMKEYQYWKKRSNNIIENEANTDGHVTH